MSFDLQECFFFFKKHSFLILKISFISSIHENATSSDKVLNEKSRFLSDFGIKTGIEL